MVNIFIIVPDIQKTAEMLDQKRLGKQRLEAYQIINSLVKFDNTGQLDKGWKKHPALQSWIGFTNHLKVYFNIITREWIKRGYKNTMAFYDIDETPYHIVESSFDGKSIIIDNSKFNQYSFPFWVSFYPFYMSHQAALLRKNPKYYSYLYREEIRFFLNIGYLWPCNLNQSDFTNWSYRNHEKLGCGTPSVYKINAIEALEWLKDPLKNPKTNRKIKKDSDTYESYENSMLGHSLSIYGNLVYYKGFPICYINDINSGILLMQDYYNRNYGIPTPEMLVKEFIDNPNFDQRILK